MAKKIFKEIRRLGAYSRDFKNLRKRFKTLDDDEEKFTTFQLKLTHKLGIDNKGVVRISDLGVEKPKIFKARKFACRALKGSGSMSGIRIIYAYCEEKDAIEFIEIYYKGDKQNEDRKRIKAFIGNYQCDVR